jgi:hypothetical protein
MKEDDELNRVQDGLIYHNTVSTIKIASGEQMELLLCSGWLALFHQRDVLFHSILLGHALDCRAGVVLGLGHNVDCPRGRASDIALGSLFVERVDFEFVGVRRGLVGGCSLHVLDSSFELGGKVSIVGSHCVCV